MNRNVLPVRACLTRISIELTNQCSKGCWFCYNHSGPQGATQWTVDALAEFIGDCADHGVRAVSFGGGEPLEYDGLFSLLDQLRGVLFLSLTTNGLLLDNPMLDRLQNAAPDKVHVSIHFPGSPSEVSRVISNVQSLSRRGIRGGVNLLVQRSRLDAAKRAAQRLRQSGIENDSIVYLPMRGRDTPSPEELASVAGDQPFQSMTCLSECGPSERFCSIGWDRRVAWCSYTTTRRRLEELTYQSLMETTDGLGLAFCGNIEPKSSPIPRIG